MVLTTYVRSHAASLSPCCVGEREPRFEGRGLQQYQYIVYQEIISGGQLPHFPVTFFMFCMCIVVRFLIMKGLRIIKQTSTHLCYYHQVKKQQQQKKLPAPPPHLLSVRPGYSDLPPTGGDHCPDFCDNHISFFFFRVSPSMYISQSNIVQFCF